MLKIFFKIFFAILTCIVLFLGWHVLTKPGPLDIKHMTSDLSSMSFKGKVLMGFEGKRPQDPGVVRLASDLRTGLLGGVIFFPRNVESPQQVKELITFIKSASPTPLWIAVDQEGGVIQTLTKDKGFLESPSAKTLASTTSPDGAKAHYTHLARQLADLGFNLNFGPVVDFESAQCPVIGKLGRSYGADPVVISTYASMFVDAHKDQGITTCLKHYPGHGYTVADSHIAPIDITKTHTQDERTLFRVMIQRDKAPMVMVAHLIHQGMDPERPASLSAPIIKGRLRGEDGFKGLVVSDDLHMEAIQARYTTRDAVRLALQAGCDLVIVSNNLKSQPERLLYPLARPLKDWLRTL